MHRKPREVFKSVTSCTGPRLTSAQIISTRLAGLARSQEREVVSQRRRDGDTDSPTNTLPFLEPLCASTLEFEYGNEEYNGRGF